MPYKFSDIVDIEAVQALMDKLWDASGIPTGIIDVDGTVLVATGWQEICSRFHRQHPETYARCLESDSYLTRHLENFAELPECGYIEYQCRNGMVDIAIPIVIEGRHLANIFLGQFFYEPPQEQAFIIQARRYGFDQKDYLQALHRVPIFPRQKVQEILAFDISLVELLTRMGVEKLRQLEAKNELAKSEEKFRTLFECSNDGVYILEPGGKMLEANHMACKQFGLSREKLLGKTMPELLAPDKAGNFENRVQEIQRKGQLVFESSHLRMDGVSFPVEISVRPFDYGGKPALLGTFRDISQRKRAEEDLRTSLREKEMLLREIHHRVKNNLQVVSSLLYLQSECFSDPELAAAFLDSQSRICSMALAHEQLYQSKNLAEVNIKAYVENLVKELRHVFLTPRQEISWHLQLEEFVLDIEKVVPFGLLLTELVSNSYKHAFNDGKNGSIEILLCRCGEEVVLAVADDGMGLPADFDWRQAQTLGLQLVNALVLQLNGSLELERAGGTLFRLRFVP